MALLLALLSVVASSARVGAQSGPSLVANEFNIDLVTGPIVGSGRIVGLGGAYTALATGIDGAAWNPVAYAARTHWENDFFEWDVTADYAPGAFKNTDFDNNGETGFTYRNFVFLTFGLRADFGGLGFGGLARVQDYRLEPDADLTLWIVNYGGAYSFLDGQIVVGLAARTALLGIVDSRSNETLVDFTGTGPELGVLFGFEGTPYRIGASTRLPVDATKSESTRVAAGLSLPRHVVLPAELQLGFAFQLGDRPLNRRFVDPRDIEASLRRAMLAARYQRQREQAELELRGERARILGAGGPATSSVWDDPALRAEPRDPEFWQEELRVQQLEEVKLQRAVQAALSARDAEVLSLSRRYALISTEMIFTGQTDSGVGLESFLSQRSHASGRDVSVGFRLGIEGEPIANWLKLRAGTYLEPSRFEGVPYRGHATMGSEVRLFEWDVFGLVSPFMLRFGVSVDLAPRYTNIGFGLGNWH